MPRLLRTLAVIGLMAATFGWYGTLPAVRDTSALEALTGNPVNGEMVFWASGCASCHMAPGATGADQLILAGGLALPTQFGTFYAPNISSDREQGIGGWSIAAFAHALQDGVTGDGAHEYPAMPYLAYAKMAPQDLVDLKTFLDTLPASATPNIPHDLTFPFSLRSTLGVWKLWAGQPDYVMTGDLPPVLTRGRYLAEALAHCGECHTPRDELGALRQSAWLSGAVIDAGKVKVPNITPAKLVWTQEEIFTYLTTGSTPEFDYAGGAMAHVVDNLAHLPKSDIMAIVAYLRAAQPIP